MRVVLQRVSSGSVIVKGRQVAKIDQGLVLLLGIGVEDTNASVAQEKINYLVEKIANLRIFEDGTGKMNRSLLEVTGSVIVVSQFTLYADTLKGRRPSFTNAASPDIALPLVDQFVDRLSSYGVPVQTGEFGEHMLVDIVNDGPVTILLER